MGLFEFGLFKISSDLVGTRAIIVLKKDLLGYSPQGLTKRAD